MLSENNLYSMPNFFEQSEVIRYLHSNNRPLTKIWMPFDKPPMDGFLDTFDRMIDSGKLFEYEDYNYLDNGNVVNNLEQCRNLYKKVDGEWTFLRRERMKTGQNLNFTVYNKRNGWFPEIEQSNPELVTVCNDLIDDFKIDVFKILVFKMDQDLVWHQDMDGYYGFRLFMGHADWTLKFRKIKPEYKSALRDLTWLGHWDIVNDAVEEACFPEEIVYTAEDNLGQAYLINSMDYVHYFENTKPMWGAFIKGVV